YVSPLAVISTLISYPTRRTSDLRSSYFATFRHQLTILSKTDALDEEKWLNMLGTFVKDWFRYESHFVHGRDSLVDILKERDSYRSEEWFSRNAETDLVCCVLFEN